MPPAVSLAVAILKIGQVPRKTGGAKNGKIISRVPARLIARKFPRRSGHFGDRPKRANSSRCAHRAARSHACGHADVRACMHARSLGIGNGKSGKNGRKRPKSANRPVGRKRPRRRGQNRAGCVATAVSTGSATIGRNANRAIPGASKSKSARSTWTSEHSYTRSLSACEYACSAAIRYVYARSVATVEKHERSLRLFVPSWSMPLSPAKCFAAAWPPGCDPTAIPCH